MRLMHRNGGGTSRDRHHLYECAVQSLDADLDFVERVFRKRHGRRPRRLREDFCGTAALACAFVKRRPENAAIGVDLCAETLRWGRAHNVRALGEQAARLRLLRADVRRTTAPKADVSLALNFSYWVLKSRPELAAYFRAAHHSLVPGGLLVLDLFGGAEAMQEGVEKRRIPGDVCFDGSRVERFTYVWDQARFDAITHEFQCHIHFRLQNGREMRKAFSYDWRFWTLPELRELLREAGFRSSAVYTDDWDDASDESNGIYRRRRFLDNGGVWVGYLVAEK